MGPGNITSWYPEAMLTCHSGLSIEWLDWVAILSELCMTLSHKPHLHALTKLEQTGLDNICRRHHQIMLTLPISTLSSAMNVSPFKTKDLSISTAHSSLFFFFGAFLFIIVLFLFDLKERARPASSHGHAEFLHIKVVVEAQWPIGYGVGLRIKRSSVRNRPGPLRCVESLRWVSLLPFTLASIGYLAILVKYILAKKKKKVVPQKPDSQLGVHILPDKLSGVTFIRTVT